MPSDRIAQAWRWLSTFPVNPHPDLGRDGVVCPYMGGALRRELVKLHPFDARDGDEALTALARQLRGEFLKHAETVGAERVYMVWFAVPDGLPDAEMKAMVGRVHTALKPEFLELGLMAGDFWPDHETAGLHSETFRPFASPLPMLGMRHMVIPDLPFFVGSEVPPESQLRYLGYYKRAFADQLGGIYADRVATAEAAARQRLEDRPIASRTAS